MLTKDLNIRKVGSRESMKRSWLRLDNNHFQIWSSQAYIPTEALEVLTHASS